VLVFFFALLFLTMRKWIAITALVLTIAGVDSEPLHTPRQFDYYVLSLSWSPQYCAGSNGRNDSKQCGTGRRFGFVVHGLWPNNNRPPHPSNCAPSSSVPPDLVKDMLRIMPSPRLIQHEWDSHGVCSGVSLRDFFALTRTAFRAVNIPQPYRQPTQDLRVSAEEIRQQFQEANSAFPPNSIKLDCSGQYFREARVCFDKTLSPRVCGSSVRDTCGSRSVTLRRVR
jgi:ribonuclease T2